jgi:hypothetical protein
MTPLGQAVSRSPKVGLLVLKPLPGERQKSSHLLMIVKPWRSKWARVQCFGEARACRAGECRHVGYVVDTYGRVKSEPRETS